MKITYFKTIDIVVRYDNTFDYRIEDCPINEVRDKVEKEMWEHLFKVADITDAYTGEILLTIEKDY